MPGQGQSPFAANHADARALESLLTFWAEAGVDTAIDEVTVDRLADRVRPIRAPAKAARIAEAAFTAAPSVQAGPASPDAAAAIAEARRLAASAQTLEELKAVIAGFDGCGLKFEGARQAVFARGEPDAPVMVIGEGPGGDEDVQGAPFVGRAGKLLDKMLKAAGIEGRVFITNTVFWRPPGNRTPTPQEQAVCAPFVERAIALVQPKIKFMLQKPEGILSLRGRWFDWRSSDGEMELPAMPTLHPAFLLRQPAAKKKAWGDLLMLSERLDRPERPG
jgi:uracil-DNA glycosylase family 4